MAGPPTVPPRPAPMFQVPSSEVIPLPPAAERPVREPSPPAPGPPKGLQNLTEALAVVVFLTLTAIPLARLGLVPLDPVLQVDVLAAASALLTGLYFLHRQARYRPRSAVESLLAHRRRDDAILNALSLATVVVLAVVFLVELGATMVFLGVIRRTAPIVVTAAQHFLLFAMFTLLFLDLLLIARTSFHSRVRPRTWFAPVSYALFGLAAALVVLTLLKNHALLDAGAFAAIQPQQSTYILALASFCQLFAFRWLLAFPSLRQVFTNQLDVARRAGHDERLTLERRALRAYLLGLAFVLVSMLLVGGVATGRLAAGRDPRTTNLILVSYIAAAIAIFAVVLARYLQHRFLEDRERRRATGEVVAKRRMTPEQLANLFVYGASLTFALLFLALGILTFLKRTPFKPSLGTDFFILAFLVGVGPYGFKRGRYLKKVRAMDEKFPDFLRDLAEGLRAGMTLPRALYASSRGFYGALTPEIRHMSAQVEWGISFTEALQRFAERVRTPLIQRTVSLVNEASRAGGNVVEILTAASSDAREIKQIIDDRRRQMGIYSVIIYVAFLVFLVVIWVLAAQFLPSFQDAMKGASGQQVGGLSFAPFKTSTYTTVFFHAGLIQGIGGGLVAGVMTEGHPLGGLKHSFIMTIMSWVFFRVLL